MFHEQQATKSYFGGKGLCFRLITVTTLIYIRETHNLTRYACTMKSPDTGGHANAVSTAGTRRVATLWQASIQMKALFLQLFLANHKFQQAQQQISQNEYKD